LCKIVSTRRGGLDSNVEQLEITILKMDNGTSIRIRQRYNFADYLLKI